MNELNQKSATELAELIKSKEVSSKEVVETHLKRIEEVNPEINAITVTLEDSATELAKKADFVIKPDTLGLHWSDFQQFDALVDNGRKAAKQCIDQLKIEINRKKSPFFKLKQWLS